LRLFTTNLHETIAFPDKYRLSENIVPKQIQWMITLSLLLWPFTVKVHHLQTLLGGFQRLFHLAFNTTSWIPSGPLGHWQEAKASSLDLANLATSPTNYTGNP
jgi:hypothetical protein